MQYEERVGRTDGDMQENDQGREVMATEIYSVFIANPFFKSLLNSCPWSYSTQLFIINHVFTQFMNDCAFLKMTSAHL